MYLFNTTLAMSSGSRNATLNSFRTRLVKINKPGGSFVRNRQQNEAGFRVDFTVNSLF